MIDAAGPQAGRIQGLWWFFFWVLAAVFIIVMVMTLITLMRHSPENTSPAAIKSPDQRTESRMTKIVTGATIVTIIILFVFLIASIGAGKSISELPNKKSGITIEVTGNQWWWQIRYLNSNASQVLTTANEMHIPVGRPGADSRHVERCYPQFLGPQSARQARSGSLSCYDGVDRGGSSRYFSRPMRRVLRDAAHAYDPLGNCGARAEV